MDDQRESRLAIRKFAALSFLCATVTAVLIFRDGIEITPDGWAYWQGSVSLLESGQYSYFREGEPIRLWPPAYSAYLAGCQALLGVSGRTLVIANVLLIALAAALWTALNLYILRPFLLKCHDSSRYLIAVYLALYFAVALRFLLATNLLYVWMPVFFAAVIALRAQASPTRFALLALVAATTGAAALLTHNSALAILPVAGLMALANRTMSLSFRLATGTAVVVLAVVPWYVVRMYLGQGGSHEMGWGAARYGPIEYGLQLLNGLCYLVASKPGILIGPGIALILVRVTIRARGVSTARLRAISNSVWCAAVPCALLYLMFNVTYIYDSLSGRFLLFAPALLVPLALVGWRWDASFKAKETSLGPVNRYAAICLIVVMAVSLQRSMKRIAEVEEPATPHASNVHYTDTISAHFLDDSPQPTKGGMVLISPPQYDFSENSSDRMAGETTMRR